MSKSGWFGPAGLSAIATVIFAFVAFFKDTVLRYLRRPKLRGELLRHPPDTSLITDLSGATLAYFRLKVWNKGKTAADKVEVYAKKLQIKDDEGFRDLADFLPMNLTWAHLDAHENIYLQTIPPHTYKHCDLGHIGKPDFSAGSAMWNSVAPTNVLWINTPDLDDSSTFFILSTQIIASNYGSYLPKGEYLLTVVLAAANAKPQEVIVRIVHEGSELASLRLEGVGSFAEIV